MFSYLLANVDVSVICYLSAMMFSTRLVGDKMDLPYLVLVINCLFIINSLCVVHNEHAKISEQNKAGSRTQAHANLKTQDTCGTVCIVTM